ncbi:MAG: hypothetical protein ABUS79_24815, partial [Pseudomonadota bacterium]
ERRQHAETHDQPLQHILTLAANGPTFPRSLPALFFHMPFEALAVWRGLRRSRSLFLEKTAYTGFRGDLQAFRRLRTKFQFHRHFKRLMSVWRALHVVLAIVLLGLIGMHVWVSVRVGFRWLWS